MEALLGDEIFAGLARGMRFAVTDTFRHVAVLPAERRNMRSPRRTTSRARPLPLICPPTRCCAR